jgi:mannose-6-phosphate isomerase-like protein (cupin superfamily)
MRCESSRKLFSQPVKNATKTNETKEFDLRQAISVLYQLSQKRRPVVPPQAKTALRYISLLLLLSIHLLAQDRKVDPTWLHRYLPRVSETTNNFTSATCHYKPVFGEGDADTRILRSATHFGEVSLDAHGSCQKVMYEREEEIYFVLEGKCDLEFGSQKYAMRANDFTYIPPGASHVIAGASDQKSRVLVMSFQVPKRVSINPSASPSKIVNLDDLKEETVDGHPNSVLYKLLVGPRTAKRDAIDDAYVVTSFFWMDFAPGGTNFPHHHETAEEIYLVLDGQGEMVAGSGMDGLEGRYPAQAGDAYYFRPNCTVGFYNADKPGAKAHILAVRSRIPLPENED